MWEYFREGHIPVCEDIVEPPDIFNDAAGIDQRDDESPDEEEPESIF